MRQFVADLSPWRPGFNPTNLHVDGVVNKMAMGQTFTANLELCPINIIPPTLHSHLFSYHRRYTILSMNSDLT